ncbi:MAG: hypothetical protein ACKVOQ_12465 [Cyclobacteriaceae bacterium]
MKIKSNIPLAIVFLATINVSVAQSALPNQLQAANTMERMGSGIDKGDLMFGIPLPPGKTIADFYLTKHWNISSILLYGAEKPLEGYRVKYDAKNEWIEISTQSGVRVLDCNQIKKILAIDSVTGSTTHFINAREFVQTEIKLTGLVELLVEGKAQLLKKTILSVRKPDYNPALAIGNRDEKIDRHESFYAAVDGKLVKIKNNKDLISVCDKNKDAFSKFTRANKLSARREADLKRMVEFMNGQ